MHPEQALPYRRRRLPEHHPGWRSIIAFEARYRTILTLPIARLLLTVAIIVPAIIAPIPFPYKVPLFAALALVVTWMQTGGLSTAGLRLPRRLGPTLLWALLGAVLVIVVVARILSPVIEWMAGIETDYSGYGELEGNLGAAATLLGYALFSAAIAEEIVYRGFLLDQISGIFDSSLFGKVVAVVFGGIIFALPHSPQGLVGMTTVALTGMIFGWIFFQSGRNLWAVMLAHALVDIWGVSMLYLGW